MFNYNVNNRPFIGNAFAQSTSTGVWGANNFPNGGWGSSWNGNARPFGHGPHSHMNYLAQTQVHQGRIFNSFNYNPANTRPFHHHNHGRPEAAPPQVDIFVRPDTGDRSTVKYYDENSCQWQPLDPRNPPFQALTPDNIGLYNHTQDTFIPGNSNGARVVDNGNGGFTIGFEDRTGSAPNDRDYNDVFVNIQNNPFGTFAKW
ncbi:DUF4114 domain-containing protein [Thiolinea disciformis]|uniref:DUF4114 domain-containing protein n=1 Tax=Thiolinea disciformis TaxID=125614 RepID=UPI00037229BC|nr:DUF4114 domain-containing protein [Thiolinea disciformis]